MSGSYASRLSAYNNKGVCGLPERFDKERTLTLKLDKLLKWLKEANHVVVLTGAGISTSAGIPDFRGPKGIWTQEQEEKKSSSNDNKNKKRKRDDDSQINSQPTVTFDTAGPTLTHRALTQLIQTHHQIQYVVTQNVDGLHRRSGLSRDYHSVLHGCVFTECCEACRVEHFRDFEIQTMSFAKTGRACDKCGGALRDTLLDWEDALPEFDWERAQKQCERADLVLALGTSLRIEPAGSLPTMGKRFAIVNLQETPYDKKASLLVRAKVDQVMTAIMQGLGHGSNWDESSEPVVVEKYWKQPKSSDEKEA